jgi:hypothetical protein
MLTPPAPHKKYTHVRSRYRSALIMRLPARYVRPTAGNLMINAHGLAPA